MPRFSLAMIVLLGPARYAAAGAALSGPVAFPMQCPSSGVLHLDAGEYSAQNVSLGNCTVVGKAPAAVIHGKVSFDHGLLKGAIHFEGGGAPSSCVAGAVEVNGDDVRFHGCDIGIWADPFPGPRQRVNAVNVSGGRARFEYGKQVCGLTIVAGSVDVTNISGCEAVEGLGRLLVGPGPVNLNMTNVKHYGEVDIDGMKGRLGGTLQTDGPFSIKNSLVQFDAFGPQVNNLGASFYLDNVTGSGSVEYFAASHSSSGITNCQFNDMMYSVSMQRGPSSISGTTWKAGSYSTRSSSGGFTVGNSDLQNVSVSAQLYCDSWSGAEITSSYMSGKIGLQMATGSHCGLTIANSYVTFSSGGSSSVPGPIQISSSILSFPGSSGALVGTSSLVVNKSTIQVTGPLPNGPSIQIGGDIHMSNAHLDVVNCSASWLSQSSAKLNAILI